MTTDVKWNNQLVGTVDDEDDGRLVAATPAFMGLWKEFKQNGIARMTAPKGPQVEGVLADAIEQRFEVGVFLSELQGMGYEVVEPKE
jgi:hypothetical protein